MAEYLDSLKRDGLGTPVTLQQEKTSHQVVSNLAIQMPRLASSLPAIATQPQFDLDPREVYFLVFHFMANGQESKEVGQLWAELNAQNLLPRRYHGYYCRGQVNDDGNDSDISVPLSYGEFMRRNENIPTSHLMDILQNLFTNNNLAVAALDLYSERSIAREKSTLDSGMCSLLDPERGKQNGIMQKSGQLLIYPYQYAGQVHGLAMRELGGGFTGQHQVPSPRAARSMLAKPSVLFNKIERIKKFRGHDEVIGCCLLDKKGGHVITGADDYLVKIWSMESGLCLRSCRGHEGEINALSVSSSSKLLASASNEFAIRIWQLPSGVPVSLLQGHGGSVNCIAFSPRQGSEHHLLSCSDDGTCRIWDAQYSFILRVYVSNPRNSEIQAARGVVQQDPLVGNAILCCAFNADGSLFVTGSEEKLARVWNAIECNYGQEDSPNYELDSLHGHVSAVNCVQFFGCAKSFVGENQENRGHMFKNIQTGEDNIMTGSFDRAVIIIWTHQHEENHTKTGRWVKSFKLKVSESIRPALEPHSRAKRPRMLSILRGVSSIACSLDDRFVLAATLDGRLSVWSSVDGSLVHSLTGHDKKFFILDVHPFDPRIAMSSGFEGKIIIWDIWEGYPIRMYSTQGFQILGGQFSPDGLSFVVTDEVGHIYLFGTGDGNSLKSAKHDQFFLGDFRPLVQDTNGNLLDEETQLPPHETNLGDLLCDIHMIPYPEPYQTLYQQQRLGALGIDWKPHTMSL